MNPMRCFNIYLHGKLIDMVCYEPNERGEQPMTPQNLKEEYESFKARNGERGYYFSSDTMEFFGDIMANYKVTEETIDGTDYYVLHRKRPIKKSHQSAGPCAYFRKSDMRVSSIPHGDW